MQALAVLPHLTPEDDGEPRWECSTCEPLLDLRTKRGLHCGRIDRRTWIEPVELPPIAGVAQLDECPGSLVRRPLVCEIAGAFAAYDKGALGAFYGGEENIPNIVIEGVLALGRAVNGHAADRLRRMKR